MKLRPFGVAVAAIGLFACNQAPGGAIVNGVAAERPWFVRLSIREPGHEPSACSGALITPTVVMTAAHCVTDWNTKGDIIWRAKPADVTTYVGFVNASHMGSRSTVKTVNVHPTFGVRPLPHNDVALLTLSSPVKNRPLWLAPLPYASKEGTKVQLFGSGNGVLQATIPGAYSLTYKCDPHKQPGNVCYKLWPGKETRGAGGDSGGSWVGAVDGSDISYGIYTGYTAVGSTFISFYGAGTADPGNAAFIRKVTGIPAATRGHIVRDPKTGQSWHLDMQGYRLPILDGITYQCLVHNGTTVDSLPGASIALMAARVKTKATCVEGRVGADL